MVYPVYPMNRNTALWLAENNINIKLTLIISAKIAVNRVVSREVKQRIVHRTPQFQWVGIFQAIRKYCLFHLYCLFHYKLCPLHLGAVWDDEVFPKSAMSVEVTTKSNYERMSGYTSGGVEVRVKKKKQKHSKRRIGISFSFNPFFLFHWKEGKE